MKTASLENTVKRNLALFKHLVQKVERFKMPFHQAAEKTYKAYLHKKTGAILFEEMIEQQGSLSGEWKDIEIEIAPAQEEPFCIYEKDTGKSFAYKDLTTQAQAVVAKTIHILNELCHDVKKENTHFWILRQVSKLDLELFDEEGGKKSLIKAAWFQGTREEAEKKLMVRPRGTYLFRKGAFATALEENLNRNFSMPISCFSLTYSIGENGISEKIVVNKDGAWLIYNDDPNLSGPSFPTVEELLANWGEFLQVSFQKY